MSGWVTRTSCALVLLTVGCSTHGAGPAPAPPMSGDDPLPRPLPPLPDPSSDAAPCAVDADAGSFTLPPLSAGAFGWVKLGLRNIDMSQGTLSVLFDGVAAQVAGYDPTSSALTVIVPEGAHSGPITIVSGCAVYTNLLAFTVDDVPAGVVTSASPATATVGSVVTVRGRYFTSTSSVWIGDAGQFGGAPLPFTVIDDGTLDMQVAPAGITGTVGMQTLSGISFSDAGVTVTP